MVAAAQANLTKTIVISGYYGFDNSGDEAVLQSILFALEEQGRRHGVTLEPVVLSADPETTAKTYGVRAIPRMQLGALLRTIRSADGLISGGGSLLQDATGTKTIPYYLAILKIAQWLGKPTFIYSQGIGPVNRRFFDGWIHGTFHRCRYISVRDQESAQLLQSMGLAQSRIEIVPDPVMGLPLRNTGKAGPASSASPVVGVSVRFWNASRSELTALAAALQLLLEQRPDAQLRFLPFHLPADEEASQFVIDQLDDGSKQRVTVARGVTHPQDMLAEVASCSLLIGMRLHSLIYAASQGVPMIGISYDPKIDQFLNRLQMKAAASTDRLVPEEVVSTAIGLLDNSEEWRHEKASLIESLRTEAQLPATRIASFFTDKIKPPIAN
jgi:polysaccharide pyruvyl transferase CsaB